ncbi:hypothetical protein JYU34_020460 [Plutella xylostella]|uniref:Uncharacterized protein n=1 Tax=Plutella xylostella TaxID=51655 RepID=A0ABQ7PW37_PLUXY|nr:hypothetical protein JYU34_020460 [Plutella xylostella]
MAIGVDTSKWKPRKLKGTPANRAANLIAAGIIGFGVLCGAALQYMDFTKKPRANFEKLYEDSIVEVERKIMIGNSLPYKTGDQLRKIIEEDRQPDRPDA